MAKTTTIKLDAETKARLDHLKEHKRETYEEVIRKILFVLNKLRKDPSSANGFLSKIDRNIKGKNIYAEKQKEQDDSEN